MKFTRRGRYQFEVTPRKLAAIGTRRRHEREAAPLFAEELAKLQSFDPTPEQEMENRCRRWEEQERTDRKRRAEQWLRARRQLRLLSETDRAAVLKRYNGRWIPGDPEYLLDLIHTQTTK